METPEQVPIPSLFWSKEIRGTVVHADDNSLIPSPDSPACRESQLREKGVFAGCNT